MHASPKRLITYAEVLDKTGLSRALIHRLIAAGDFPTPVELAPRRVGFLESEIETWIENRVAKRSSPEMIAARQARSAQQREVVNRRWAKVREAAMA